MTLFDLADQRAIAVPTSCGRNGTCHECIVEVKQGMESLAPRTEAEAFLRGDYRLACQAQVIEEGGPVTFSVLQRRPKILTSSEAPISDFDPVVTRNGDRVLYDGEVIDEYRGHIYGLAMDLGTTTMVIEMVDLETGIVRHVTALENPQRFGGSDIMNRISYDGGRFRGELHNSVIHALNNELAEACRELGITRHEIYEMVVAGNSTMRDLFFNLDVQTIGQRPYKSTIEHEFREGKRASTALVQFAHKLALMTHPKARIYGAPLIASHVGADTAAALLAIDFESHDGVTMLVDIGTNTEVVVGSKDRWIAASCPAGPAFEGWLVKYGMPGCDGAIESITWNGDGWNYRTIGDIPPIGICGSGLIDLLAELRRHNLMTPLGVFPGRKPQYEIDAQSGITFSREDASHLAQAKAANYCGQFIVMREFGVTPSNISRLYLAGAFANYINVRNAIDIGFLAPVPEDRIIKAGNAAAAGARQMLLSRRKRLRMEETVKRIRHIELETTPDFFDVFVEGCHFQPMPS